MRIIIFGDSITQGYSDTEGGWADRVKRHFAANNEENGTDIGVFNLGISANTSADLVKRIEPEITARAREDIMVIIAIGTNDSIFLKNENGNSPENYLDNLTKIVEITQKFTNKIYFIGLTPVIDSLLQPIPWSRSGKCYSTERMKLFNDALESFCNDNNYSFISIWDEFANSSLETLMSDGLHPNNEGHELIAGIVLEEVKKNL